MSTLQALHDLLLDRSKWPDDFVWDYNDSNHCAIGLAYEAELIGIKPCNVHGDTFGIDQQTMCSLFFDHDGMTWDAITPEIIASRIAAIL